MVPKQLCTMSLKSMQISLPNVGTKKYRSKKCCTLNRDWWWWYHLLLPKPTRPWILNLFSTNSRRHYNKSYQKRYAQSFIHWYFYILLLLFLLPRNLFSSFRICKISQYSDLLTALVGQTVNRVSLFVCSWKTRPCQRSAAIWFCFISVVSLLMIKSTEKTIYWQSRIYIKELLESIWDRNVLT